MSKKRSSKLLNLGLAILATGLGAAAHAATTVPTNVMVYQAGPGDSKGQIMVVLTQGQGDQTKMDFLSCDHSKFDFAHVSDSIAQHCWVAEKDPSLGSEELKDDTLAYFKTNQRFVFELAFSDPGEVADENGRPAEYIAEIAGTLVIDLNDRSTIVSVIAGTIVEGGDNPQIWSDRSVWNRKAQITLPLAPITRPVIVK